MRQRHVPNRHRGRQKIADGEKLYSDMRVSVIMPGQKDIVWKHHAKPGMGWRADDINETLEKVADSVEKQYPSIEFRLVELAPNEFKFIYHGKKETMNDNLNGCPEIARSPKIAEEVCAKLGHKLSVYQNGMTQTAQGPIMQTINFCANCGLSLAEVRGDLDSRINAAVEEGIKQRLMAAAANEKASQVPKKVYASPLPPAGGPGIEIVPDATKPAVESPS
jgi:hypothetical protein